MNFVKNNPLFLIFFIPIIVDVVGTVLGQPQQYWSSGYKQFNESVPFIYLLLKIHPLLFIGFCLSVWLPFTYWLTLKLKEPYNIWATLSLLVGHGYNSIAWLRKTQYNFGIFTEPDQLSKALALLPMTVYVFFIGWIASKGLLIYFERKLNKF